MGIFHDAGKASRMFQGVLENKEHNVNHAAAGAFFLKGYKIISRVIYAHHDGLKWNIEDDLTNSFTMKESQDKEKGKRFSVLGNEQYNIVREYIRDKVGIPDVLPESKKYKYPVNNELHEMLYCRMLLSCLCDADYTATASHYDENVLKLSEERTVDAENVIKQLTAYRNDIIEKSDSDSKLNDLRNEVYHSCLEAAEKPPGMFTLTAPTGTGKTLALLAFAANHARLYGKRRIIIVLPFLSIISQNAKIYNDICGDVIESHSMASYGDDDEAKLLADKWNYPVIITTSVKFFEAFFKSKPSDLRFLHSISNSVVVFDEAQSIPAYLVGTTIETMRALCETYNSTVLFSTATQPAFDIRNKDFSAAEIISDTEKLYRSSKRVEIEWNTDDPIPLEQIADEMLLENSVCCVLNRKDHTHKLYDLLRKRCNESECFHISTDMCKSHRDKVIKEIKNRLKNNMCCRLVSTSCIEAGVDLDFKVMYRALAPLDSIVQCAGRCNRNGKGMGKMRVFIPDEEKKYPAKFIENGALKVKTLLKRHDIDINSPEHIREYYELMFTDNNYKEDKKALISAIKEHNFEKAEKEYRFIPNTGVNVLVPYKDNRNFDDLLEEAREKGISKDWMRRAAPITVTSYREHKLKNLAEQCFIKTKYGTQPINGWYIITDKKLYDEKTGLYFDDDSSLDYLI